MDVRKNTAKSASVSSPRPGLKVALDPWALALKKRAVPLKHPKDLAPLIEELAGRKIVMLGEASHGTHEFYEWRRLVSEWLITKHGFSFIAVEGDWPPAWELTRYIKHGEGGNAGEVLKHFHRWPTWMWGNEETARLAEWLRSHNERVPKEKQIGFFGLDVYSLFESMDAVLDRLTKTHPLLAKQIAARYTCFDRFSRDEKAYARSLLAHHGPDAKAIVWAHNTHIGDYRATPMLRQGHVNLGGLAREKWGEDQVSLVGFGTYEGEVIASHAWDGPIERMNVPSGREDSIEASMHAAARSLGCEAFFCSLRDETARRGILAQTRGHRAIGVVYEPQYERFGNYVPTELSLRYDAFLFVDWTTGVRPLKLHFDRREIPETYPVGM